MHHNCSLAAVQVTKSQKGSEAINRTYMLCWEMPLIRGGLARSRISEVDRIEIDTQVPLTSASFGA